MKPSDYGKSHIFVCVCTLTQTGFEFTFPSLENNGTTFHCFAHFQKENVITVHEITVVKMLSRASGNSLSSICHMLRGRYSDIMIPVAIMFDFNIIVSSEYEMNHLI